MSSHGFSEAFEQPSILRSFFFSFLHVYLTRRSLSIHGFVLSLPKRPGAFERGDLFGLCVEYGGGSLVAALWGLVSSSAAFWKD